MVVHVTLILNIASGTVKTVIMMELLPKYYVAQLFHYFYSEKINIETFNKCQSEAFEIMTNCTEQCDISYECHQVCGSDYYEELRSCPCMEQCPGSLARVLNARGEPRHQSINEAFSA